MRESLQASPTELSDVLSNGTGFARSFPTASIRGNCMSKARRNPSGCVVKANLSTCTQIPVDKGSTNKGFADCARE